MHVYIIRSTQLSFVLYISEQQEDNIIVEEHEDDERIQQFAVFPV